VSGSVLGTIVGTLKMKLGICMGGAIHAVDKVLAIRCQDALAGNKYSGP